MRQKVRILRTADGVNLAWATAGSGPALVRAATWLTHLEYDWDSPIWHHWLTFLTSHFYVIRYDERGCGMSDWESNDDSYKRWFDDFDAVVDAAKPKKPLILLGISHGAQPAISYAVRFPEHVSHLILCGGYARGWGARDDSEGARQFRAIIQLTRSGWGQDNPVYRQLFTSRFIPGGTPEQLDWFNELCRKTTTPEIAARLLEERVRASVTELLPQLKVPTLVLHATRDEVVPLSEGRLLAAKIPNARFVQLESRNHILLENEPAWERFKEEVLLFTGVARVDDAEDRVFAALSPREREILVELAEGYTNSEIGLRLSISEKTVRNHITHIFEKLGVQSRAQAIVLAKDKRLSRQLHS